MNTTKLITALVLGLAATSLIPAATARPVDGNEFEFQRSYQFASPSTAAGVLLGRVANGRTEWKKADGRTLKEVQEAEAAE